jgi:glucose 1-dehydrogenase/3-oxoacyl-[acyl-carrier protein] reductase
MGVRAETFAADFNDIDQVRNLASGAIDFLGGIDVLVNNAGITMNRPFEEVTVEQFDTLFNVNIRAMYFMTQAAAKDMIPRGSGAVINLSSVHAFHGMTEHSAYASTKGAIVSFTREVALELAPKGIRVNAIAPGWIIVDNHYKADPNIDIESAAYDIPAGFVGEPKDIGELAVFLASDAARYIVGQTLVIDGGQMEVMPFSVHFRERHEAQFGKGYVPGL